MYKAYLHIAAFFLCINVVAQDKMEADRPGETKSPELVKGNNLQLETGFRKEKLEDRQYLYQHPSAILRYGLFNALELRMELTSQTIRDNISKDKKTGFKPVFFGLKAKILPGDKWVPSIGALAEIGVPSLASGDYFTTGIPFEFRTLFGNTFDRFSIQYNAGVTWQEKENKEWSYSFAPMYKVTDKFEVFIEEYAFLNRGMPPEHYLDGGIIYYLHRNLMIDLSAGVGLSDHSSPYFLSGGFSFRIPFTGEKVSK
jgi:hypothetical protein